MINNLTRWGQDRYTRELEICDDGVSIDLDEVKELLAEQEKKTNILLDALEIENTQLKEQVRELSAELKDATEAVLRLSEALLAKREEEILKESD